MERIERLNEQWYEYVAKKSNYFFGEEKVSLADFAELAKNTFELIKSANQDYIYKNTMPEDSFAVLDYLRLISLIAQYTPYDDADDESEDRVFSVTCLVAHELLDFAVSFERVLFSNGKRSLALTEEKASGVLQIISDDLWIREDANLTKRIFEYNVYKADFSELFELAKALL